jgi:hypothetical protein
VRVASSTYSSLPPVVAAASETTQTRLPAVPPCVQVLVKRVQVLPAGATWVRVVELTRSCAVTPPLTHVLSV